MTDEVKLLPCPFCDGDARTQNCSGGGYEVVCLRCCATIFDESELRAHKLWNTRAPAPREDGWRPIEMLPENTQALLYAEYEPRICIGSFRWKEIVEDELISDHPNAKDGRRKVFQEKVTREREWDAENWGATHWRPLPSPPSATELQPTKPGEKR